MNESQKHYYYVKEKKEPWLRDFPGGPVAKAPRSQRQGPGFDPWSGS